ncbi:hypothetical protein [Streptomyces sp. NPDC048419]|uniref:hypothetical protein n=1 Tax=Streptomyces sp. NPDC048419 TaxID=3365547 RepID=UPI003721C2AF
MTRGTGTVRTPEPCDARVWPPRTQSVSHIGSAHVLDATDDFDQHDLALVRRQFPGRHVTLDGDVITVWPTAHPAENDYCRPGRS